MKNIYIQIIHRLVTQSLRSVFTVSRKIKRLFCFTSAYPAKCEMFKSYRVKKITSNSFMPIHRTINVYYLITKTFCYFFLCDFLLFENFCIQFDRTINE